MSDTNPRRCSYDALKSGEPNKTNNRKMIDKEYCNQNTLSVTEPFFLHSVECIVSLHV